VASAGSGRRPPGDRLSVSIRVVWGPDRKACSSLMSHGSGDVARSWAGPSGRQPDGPATRRAGNQTGRQPDGRQTGAAWRGRGSARGVPCNRKAADADRWAFRLCSSESFWSNVSRTTGWMRLNPARNSITYRTRKARRQASLSTPSGTRHKNCDCCQKTGPHRSNISSSLKYYNFAALAASCGQ